MAPGRILYVSRWFPDPPDNGARLRAWGQLQVLSRDHEVTLVSFTQAGQRGDAGEALTKACRRVITVPHRPFRPNSWRARAGLLSRRPRWLVDSYSAEMQQILEVEARSSRHDLVVATSSEMTAYVDCFADLPCLVDDLEIGIFAERVEGAPLSRARRRLTLAKFVHHLRRVLPRFRAAIVASDVEAALLRRAVPGYERFAVVENAVDTRACTPLAGDRPAEPRLVFAGSLTYDPNLDAMQWFCNRILPSVRAAIPEVRLTITGAVPPGGFAAPEGVDLPGRVDDVRSVVASAAVSVAPIRHGGGTRLKILEAMALGTPVVSTSKGAEGLAVVHGEHVLLANDPEVFATQVVRLLRDDDLRRRLAVAARALAVARYDVAVTGRKLTSLIDQVLDDGRRAASGVRS